MESDLSIEELKQLRIEIKENVILDIEAKIARATSEAEIEELKDDLEIAKNRLIFERMYAHLD